MKTMLILRRILAAIVGIPAGLLGLATLPTSVWTEDPGQFVAFLVSIAIIGVCGFVWYKRDDESPKAAGFKFWSMTILFFSILTALPALTYFPRNPTMPNALLHV